MTPNEMAIIAAKALDEKKGKEIAAIEVTDLTALADYFVIASGTSNTQINALCDAPWWCTCSLPRPVSSILWNVCGMTASPWTCPACWWRTERIY